MRNRLPLLLAASLGASMTSADYKVTMKAIDIKGDGAPRGATTIPINRSPTAVAARASRAASSRPGRSDVANRKIALIAGGLSKNAVSGRVAGALQSMQTPGIEWQRVEIGALPLYNQD